MYFLQINDCFEEILLQIWNMYIHVFSLNTVELQWLKHLWGREN